MHAVLVLATVSLLVACTDAQKQSRDAHRALATAASTTNTTARSNATAASTAHAIPFATMSNTDDTVMHILGFLVILAAAHPLGLLFPRLARLPLITGYLLVGIVTGPFVTNLVTTETIALLSKSINAMALSFISFQAGQEIYLPELRPQIKDILKLLFALYVTAMLLLTLVLWLGASPFFYGAFDSSCKLSIALMFGSIAVLGSPATVMAIKIEHDSNGPFTNLMLGATMTAEFVVLVSFSISRIATSVYCAKLDVSIANVFFTMGVILSNLVVGAVLGCVIVAIFCIPGGPHDDNAHIVDMEFDLQAKAAARGDVDLEAHAVDPDNAPHPHNAYVEEHNSDATRAPTRTFSTQRFFGSLYFKGFVWLFMGFVFYIGTNTISELTIAAYGHSWDIKFESLLVLMFASCLAGHYTSIRHDMHVILDSAAPIVFLPFFVMTGAGLKLDQVADAIPLMTLFVGLRYVAIFVACYCTGRFVLKLTPKQYNNLWLTMTPQAGVALGLANEIKSLSTDPWAAEFAATIVAAVVVNQIIGPVLCAMGLKKAGESSNAAKHGGSGDPVHDTDCDDLEHGGPLDPQRSVMLSSNLLQVSNAVVIGDDDVACEIALQLALHGANVQFPLLRDDRAARWRALQTTIQSARTTDRRHLQHQSSNFVELNHIVTGHSSEQSEPSDSTLHHKLAMATAPGSTTETVFFTGDSRRTLDHVKMLVATVTDRNKLPRFVAVVQDLDVIDALRKHNVQIVQPSLALANAVTRVGLSDTSQAQLMCSDSCPPDAALSVSMLLDRDATDTSVRRVLRDRRQLLQRNERRIATERLHLVPHDTLRAALGLAQLPPSAVAPTRVSMFGCSSAAQGPEYFLGNGSSRTLLASNVDGNGDIYVMGDEPASPIDGYDPGYNADLVSSRSAKSSYVGANTTPGKNSH